MERTLILTCEHATNAIPTQYAFLFKQHADVLKTHRGIDIGAKKMADHLAQHLPCDFYQLAVVSRLLIDCNRSLKNKNCFSEWSATLSQHEKDQIISEYYHAFRTPVSTRVKSLVDRNRSVLHLSIHSFTPTLNEQKRNADIGLLYDPKRRMEKNFAIQWKNQLKLIAPMYRVRMNYPYLGVSDGFTQSLRKQYTENQYIGFELECNQALMSGKDTQKNLIDTITQTLLKIV